MNKQTYFQSKHRYMTLMLSLSAWMAQSAAAQEVPTQTTAETTNAVAKQTADTPLYTGKPISLEFADMPVRAVLDVLAGFTGINIITDDSVTGNITIRMTNVPWDQAFDVVMQMRNLSVLKNGNVWIVSSKSIQTNQPIISEYIRLHYASADEMMALILGEKTQRGNINQSSRRDGINRVTPMTRYQETDETVITTERASLLSDKGTVSVDKRTNTLIIQDTAQSVANIKNLIRAIDIPVEQVMIEARIVSVNESFGRQLGVRLGAQASVGNVQVSGSQNSLWQMRNQGMNAGEYNTNYQSVNLGVADAMGRIAFGLLNLPEGILDLELSAMQAENQGEIISTPKVLTADNQIARISSGVQIPYQETTDSGATATTFKEAVLLLETTPNITPDGKIAMKLSVKNGNPITTLGNISIQEDAIETNVIVEDGQTVVLGGIYRQNNAKQTNKVPVLGDVPLLGRLFRYDDKGDEKSELLIFITPRLVK